MDASRISQYEEYLRSNYYDRLVAGQGVEEIYALLSDAPAVETWLDVGCGVTTLFWSLGLDRASRIICADMYPEALHVLRRFVGGLEIPPCYRDAALLRSKEEPFWARQIDWSYIAFDAFYPWPFPANSFDLVSQFGCFGVAPDARVFSNAVAHATRVLKPGGRLIGANWRRRATESSWSWGGANRFIDQCLLQQAVEGTGCHLVSGSLVRLSSKTYDAVLVWSMEKQR